MDANNIYGILCYQKPIFTGELRYKNYEFYKLHSQEEADAISRLVGQTVKYVPNEKNFICLVYEPIESYINGSLACTINNTKSIDIDYLSEYVAKVNRFFSFFGYKLVKIKDLKNTRKP